MRSRPRGLEEATLTHSIIGAFFEVFNVLGFGFSESVYVSALERELRRRGHEVEREYSVRVLYKGEEIAWQRLDLVVGGKVVVEVKTGLALPAPGSTQLRSYLRATRLQIGLLFHFGPKPRFLRRTLPTRKVRLLPNIRLVCRSTC